METLTLYGKIDKSMVKKQANCSIVENMVSGYVWIPMEGVAVKIKCGKHILHCSLKHTYHLPDASRNGDNWSNVCGP